MRNCLLLVGAAVLAGAFAVSRAEGPEDPEILEDPEDFEDDVDPPPAKPNQFIGAVKCKTCHNQASAGLPFESWARTKHATAFDTLASPAAKQIAQRRKIVDPQKSEACLKCHTTAFGRPAADLGKGFDPKGVQCEACHGPGGNHVEARLADAPVRADEIVDAPGAKTCARCHNKASPTHKPFCFKHSAGQVRHLDPRKERTAADLEAMKCPGDCGVEHKK